MTDPEIGSYGPPAHADGYGRETDTDADPEGPLDR